MVDYVCSVFLIADTGEVIPSEVGMVRMSVQDGVVVRHNQLIGPGTLPVGYKSDALTNSQKYHKIWLDNDQLSENYKAIVDGIAATVRANPGDGANATPAGLDIDIEKRCQRENVEMSGAAKAAVKHKVRGSQNLLVFSQLSSIATMPIA